MVDGEGDDDHSSEMDEGGEDGGDDDDDDDAEGEMDLMHESEDGHPQLLLQHQRQHDGVDRTRFKEHDDHSRGGSGGAGAGEEDSSSDDDDDEDMVSQNALTASLLNLASQLKMASASQ